jgi:hypothetical protein
MSLIRPGFKARLEHALPLVLVLSVVVVFLPSVLTGFVFDDEMLIVENPNAHDLKQFGHAFTTHFWDTRKLGESGFGLRYYRPIVAVSYLLNWTLSDQAAWSFHLVNVLLHAAVVYLGFRLAKRWLGSPWLALIAGLFLAFHGSRPETVTWISGRTDLLMALFALGAVALFRRWADSAEGGFGALAGAIVCTLFAFASKEAGAFTALLLLVDRFSSPTSGGKRMQWAIVGTLALGVGYGVFRALFYPVREDMPLVLTPRYGLTTMGTYLERIVWPGPQTLFHRCLEFDAHGPHYPPLFVALGVAVLAGGLALLVWGFRRDRAVSALVLATAAFIFPISNFWDSGIPVTVSDRFLYLPLWLLVLALLRALRNVSMSRAVRFAGVGALGCATLGWITVDLVRTRDFVDNDAFWRHEAEVGPDNPFVLMTQGERAARRGNIEEALTLIEQAISPKSLRFRLLMSSLGQYWCYGRLLHLAGGLTAPGNVPQLQALSDEMQALLELRIPTPSRQVGQLSLGFRVNDADPLGRKDNPTLTRLMQGRKLVGWTAIAVELSSNVGDDERTAELLSKIEAKDYDILANTLNVVLAEARLGHFAEARRKLEVVKRSNWKLFQPDSARLLADLESRLQKAEDHLAAATSAAGRQALVFRALVAVDLGDYLRALRIVRPAYLADPKGELAPFYAQLLMAARLEAAAVEVARGSLGEREVPPVLAEIRSHLPPHLRSLAPVQGDQTFWTTYTPAP